MFCTISFISPLFRPFLKHYFKQKQVATQQSDYLEVPKTDKEVDEKADDLVTASAVWMQGWRRSQEDAHIVQLPEDGLGVYSVFDGHSGATVSAYAADHFVEVLKATDGFKARDFEKALPLAFMKLDSDIREAKLDAGTTATVVVVDHEKNKIYCANAGDSRAVMCVGGKCVALSEDHKPNAEVEQTRIEAAGGTVEDASGVPRVNGMLAVSRGFGDFKFKDNEDIPAEAQAVTALPDVTTHDLTDDVQFIVVACDGIWDCLESHQVCSLNTNVDNLSTRRLSRKCWRPSTPRRTSSQSHRRRRTSSCRSWYAYYTTLAP